ncbi:hypothetical protein T439DRAFT_311789 [Meredithblackwellia eburnea MCA 4105]
MTLASAAVGLLSSSSSPSLPENHDNPPHHSEFRASWAAVAQHMTDQLHRHSIQPDSTFARNLANARGFSQNPRWKRHASLDGAAFRQRASSFQYDSPSGLTPYYDSPDEEKRFLSDFPSSRSSVFSLGPRSPDSLTFRRPTRRRNLVLVGVALGVLFLTATLIASSKKRIVRKKLEAAKDLLEDLGLFSAFGHSSCDNPYHELGHLTVDQHEPTLNRWIPYDTTCTTPELMAELRKTAPTNPPRLILPTPPKSKAPSSELPLPWLYGKTVLLFGDHVERFHNKDFCEFSGGAFEVITADHPMSPPPFLNGIDEKFGRDKEFTDASRPTVCYLDQYDLMVVTVFHFGLANRIEFEHEHLLQDQHFYPPVAVQDRLSHIVRPLLKSLNRTSPDLVEFSSGFWDLRHFTALDERAQKDPFGELSNERLQWYSHRLSNSLMDVGAMFPGVPLLWRSMHQPPRAQETPFSRVAALDQLGRKIVANLNKVRRRSGSRTLALPPVVSASQGGSKGKAIANDRDSTHEPFLNRVKQRIGAPVAHHDQAASSDTQKVVMGEIRIDEWGALMLGQEHLMNGMHTPPLPGGYVWGDVLLYELRRVSLATLD